MLQTTPEASSTPTTTPTTTEPEAPKTVTLESIRAERRAKAAAPLAAPASTPPAGAPDPKTAVAQIDMSDEALREATQLSKKYRAAESRIKELEPQAADAQVLAEYRRLKSEGKHVEAARVIEFDSNAYVTQSLGMPPEEIADPRQEAVAKEIADLKAANAERSKRDEEQAQAARQVAVATDHKLIAEYVTTKATEFPYLSRNEEWQREAYVKADAMAPELVKKLGRKPTPQESHDLVIAALEVAELRHAANAALYAAGTSGDPLKPTSTVPNPPAASSTPKTFTASMRGGTSTQPQSAPTQITYADLKAEKARRQRTAKRA